MSNYFNNFPLVDYNFGDNELPVQFQHLGTYVDIIDQVKEFEIFYQKYEIPNLWRPDHVSQKLYENPNYGWTFFLLNDNLRTSGWPLDNSRLYPLAQQYYPNITVATVGTITEFISGTIKPIGRSDTLYDGTPYWAYFPSSKRAGRILKVNLDLAQVVVELDTLIEESTFVTIDADAGRAVEESGGSYIPSISVIQDDRERYEISVIQQIYNQYDAPHHYEDAQGKWVYPTYENEEPYQFDWSSVTTQQSVSYFQRLREKNDELRNIRVIKPDTIIQIATEFNKALRLF